MVLYVKKKGTMPTNTTERIEKLEMRYIRESEVWEDDTDGMFALAMAIKDQDFTEEEILQVEPDLIVVQRALAYVKSFDRVENELIEAIVTVSWQEIEIMQQIGLLTPDEILGIIESNIENLLGLDTDLLPLLEASKEAGTDQEESLKN